ncbi:Translation elongation factor 1 beta, partial [Ceratobasidium sp. 392]
PKTIAKSVVTLEVKPWDDETDMDELEKSVRSIEQEGLVWGSSKLVAIGYGIKKLQITLVIEDELVSLDELQEKIAEFEDYVQSSDVAAMQKTPIKTASKRRRAPPNSSPVKTPKSKGKPTKRQTKLDFSTRQSAAGSSSSPVKLDFAESSETDASSDVNEVKFEEPGVQSTQRPMLSSSEDGGGEVVELESSEEEDVKVVRRRIVKKVVDVSDSEEEEDGGAVAVKGRAGKGGGMTSDNDVVDVENDSEDEGEVVISAKRAGKRKAVALSLTPTSEDEPDTKRGGRIIRYKRAEPEEEEESEEDIMDGLDEHVVLDSRLRSAPTRNSKMVEMRQNLERLKRRKLGRDSPVQPSSDESESENEDQKTREIVRPRGRRVFKPIPGAQPTLQD